MNKQEIFEKLKDDLSTGEDFNAFLSQKILFENREWTAGQFLYKYFYDQIQPFAYNARQGKTAPEDKHLIDKLMFLHQNKLISVKDFYPKMQAGTLPDVDMFDGNREKENLYRNLFAGPDRSTPDNPCHWTPVSQYYTRFIEDRLEKMGMSEEQIISLMIHCEGERKKTEQKARETMPEQFIHNSPLPPDKMEGDVIRNTARPTDDFLNLQKYGYVAKPDSFHSGLPIQDKDVSFCAWPRWSQNVCAFQMTSDMALDKFRDSYNYKIDMAQKDAIRPVIPLWGGKPQEWVSIKPLTYDKNVEKETLHDLVKQGKEFYLVPDKADWNNLIAGHENLTEEEARKYMAKLAEKYPDKVLKIDTKFLAHYRLKQQLKGKPLSQKNAVSLNSIFLESQNIQKMNDTPLNKSLIRYYKNTGKDL